MRTSFTIRWGFGKNRLLSIESQPGTIGSTLSTPLDSITIQSNATDTIRGIYAVVRDEYGFCIDAGNSSANAIWGFSNPAALSYLSLPGPLDSLSACWLFKKASPAAQVNYQLIANGIATAGIVDQKDSIKIKLANYNYSRIEIVAAEYFQGFAPGDIIPRNSIIRTGCDRTVRMYAQAYYNDSLFDIKPVYWENSSVSSTNPEQRYYGIYYSITPIAYSLADTIFVNFITDGGISIYDTLLYTVDPPIAASVRIDSSRGNASGVQTISIIGNLAELRSKTVKLFSYATSICPAMTDTRAFGTWSTSITDSWILPLINQSERCSITVPLIGIPDTKGDHSLSGTVSFRYGNLTTSINITIKDTTDYDTLEALIPDTTSSPSVATFQDYLQKIARSEYSMHAGDTLRLRSRFYDINASSMQGVLYPKYIGSDTIRWEIRSGTEAPVSKIGASFKHTRTIAGTVDTIIATYPSSLRAFFPETSYPQGVSELRHTIIVRWTPSTPSEVRLNVSDVPTPSPLSSDTIVMNGTQDTVTLYAIVYDRFGNIVSSADKMIWSTDSSTWIGVPSQPTHTGVIIRKAVPTFLASFLVEATLPANSYLGSGIYSPLTPLTASIILQTGNFTTDRFKIVSVSSLSFNTTAGGTIFPGDTVKSSDTILVRSCDDMVTLAAYSHSTNPAVGINGWTQQSVLWTDPLSSGIRSTYAYSPDNSVQTFKVRVDYLGFADTVNFRLLPEYGRSLTLYPITTDRRIVIEGDTTRIRQASAYLYTRITTNCGRTVDTSVKWTAKGFTNPGWLFDFQFQLGTAQTSSKILNFTQIARDTTPQSDSGFISVLFSNTGAPVPDSLRDSLKLVIIDRTDYDTLDVTALVPYSAYRQTIDKDGLYGAYGSVSSQNMSAGDTLRISPLFFDRNSDGFKYLGIGRIPGRDYRTHWYLNGVQQFSQPDSVFSRTTRSISNDTIIANTIGSSGAVISSDTIIINWIQGHSRILYLENQPGTAGTSASHADTLVLPGSIQKDTVYGVIRDEYGNFVSNADIVRWSMLPVNYYSYLRIPNPNLPTSIGTIDKLASPASTLIFAFIGRIERNTEIAGVTTGNIIRDTAYIRMVNYDYTAIDIQASSSNISDTSGASIASGQTIPINRIIKLTALEDSISVKSMLMRDDTAKWEQQAVTWRVSGRSLFDTTLPLSSSAILKPRRANSLDTLFASRINGNTVTLRDTMLFKVMPPWIDTIIVIFNPNPGAGDTVSITIIAIDKAGDTIKDPSRLPDTFSITNPGDVIVTDTGTPFPGGTVISIVPVVTGNDTIVITIPIPRPDGSIDTLRDTIVINTNPSKPDSIAIIKTGGNDTLITAGSDLSVSTATIEVRIFDQFGNLIPASNPIYDSIRVNIGGVLDSTDTIRTGDASFTINVLSNTASGTGFLSVYVPGHGSSFSDTLSLFIAAAVQIVQIATHEWVPDTSDISTIRQVLINVLGRNPDSLVLADTSTLSDKTVMLNELIKGGYSNLRDGYLDYLTIRFSEPVDMQTSFITDISFKGGIQYKTETSWRLADSLTGRTIYFEPLDNPINGKNAVWRLWLITNADRAEAYALETGFRTTISFSNTRIRSYASATSPLLLGDGKTSYTVPMEKIIDSAPPVINRALFRNNACDLANPNNALVLTFSEPVQTASLPIITSLTALSLNDGSGYDSLFTAELVLSSSRIDFVEDTRLAWNYSDNPDRMMAWQLIVDRNRDSRFKVGRSKIRFSLDPQNSQLVDLNGNRACAQPAKSVTIIGDVANASYLCDVSGINEVSRDDARFFSWSAASENGQQYPLFPYFGFSVNLDLIVNKSPLEQIGPEIKVGTKSYVVMDLDTSLVIVNSEVKIFDLIGNHVADPSSNNALRTRYTVGTVRRYLGMESNHNISNLTETEIEQRYDVLPAANAWEPDTLIPQYPATLPIDFEFMSRNCGKGATPCIPAWNCYNFKGRLVSPGGYIAIQTIATPAGVKELTRKLIVKGGKTVSGMR
ncbi:MAG: hypothetical protein JNL74_00995 [Fibrobacteres bacterium]|nr:hypothetical protein [Fibrobacterota bacterium]